MPTNPFEPPKEVNERPPAVVSLNRLVLLFVLVLGGLFAFGWVHGLYVRLVYGPGH